MLFLNNIAFQYQLKSDNMIFARTDIDGYSISVRFTKIHGCWVISFFNDSDAQIYLVFNAVAAIIRDFIANTDPNTIIIKAKGTSRIRLYKKLLPRLTRFGYNYSERTFGKMIFFRFEK